MDYSIVVTDVDEKPLDQVTSGHLVKVASSPSQDLIGGVGAKSELDNTIFMCYTNARSYKLSDIPGTMVEVLQTGSKVTITVN